MSMVRPRHVSRWVVVATSLWLCITVGWVGALMYKRDTVGPTSCPLAPGSSTYGEASWGWLPPGTTCTWTFTEAIGDVGQLERTPSPSRILTALVLLLWGLSLLVLGSATRARPSSRERVGAITPGW